MLTEDALCFVSKGIEITVPWGPDKWDKSGFSIDDTKHGRRIWLSLFSEDVSFLVHRDIFQQKEWEVSMEETD